MWKKSSCLATTSAPKNGQGSSHDKIVKDFRREGRVCGDKRCNAAHLHVLVEVLALVQDPFSFEAHLCAEATFFNCNKDDSNYSQRKSLKSRMF